MADKLSSLKGIDSHKDRKVAPDALIDKKAEYYLLPMEKLKKPTHHFIETIESLLKHYSAQNKDIEFLSSEDPIKHEFGHGGEINSYLILTYKDNIGFTVINKITYDTTSDDSTDYNENLTIDLMLTEPRFRDIYDVVVAQIRSVLVK